MAKATAKKFVNIATPVTEEVSQTADQWKSAFSGWFEKKTPEKRGLMVGLTIGLVAGMYIATFLSFFDLVVLGGGIALVWALLKVFKKYV